MSCRTRRQMAVAGTAVAVLLPVVSCSAAPDTAPTAATTPPTASPAPVRTTSPPPPPLTGTAAVTRRHPTTGTKVGVVVSTAPGALITVVAHFEAGNRKKTARADTAGRHTFWFPVGSATAGSGSPWMSGWLGKARSALPGYGSPRASLPHPRWRSVAASCKPEQVRRNSTSPRSAVEPTAARSASRSTTIRALGTSSRPPRCKAQRPSGPGSRSQPPTSALALSRRAASPVQADPVRHASDLPSTAPR